ncbi:hypothetical protein [Actinomadura kijaniata]|uniref:hypothetical protein n=1 Tax=Actinomadura kijaniata TaxID=46161 RepID=UPI000832B6E2|nr:hypothetical protein [Actinomadura kijaniata]
MDTQPIRRAAFTPLTVEEIETIEDKAGAITATDQVIPLASIHDLARTARLLAQMLTVETDDESVCPACRTVQHLPQVARYGCCLYHLGHAHGWDDAARQAIDALAAPEWRAARQALSEALAIEI